MSSQLRLSREHTNRARPERDRGATAVELALLFPLIVLVLAGIIQFALYQFARQIATSAAQAGARVARTQAEPDPTGWQTAARDHARDRIDTLGPSMVEDVQITALDPGGGVVGVRIRAEVPNLWPDFLVPDLDETSLGPVEEFKPDLG
ncbi:MAG: pilus assembly protein [Sporichthyaceae bacterium]|nr:pilus assembly protein [Sporichthyaceae bacterium]